MSHVSLPCPKCSHIWKWIPDKDPETAFCPKDYGCAAEHNSSESIDKKLDEVNNRLVKIERDLSWVIQYLLKRDQPIQPPPYTPTPFPSMPTWPDKTYCSKCGMEWSGVMGYVCNDQKCPVQTKITC